MINWDEPYGEHFGGNGKAKYTQDGTDFNAKGLELDGDGTVVEELTEAVDAVEEQPSVRDGLEFGADRFDAAMNELDSAIKAGSAETTKVNPAAQDWSAFKTEVGAVVYDGLSKDERRAGAVRMRLGRMN